MRWYTSDHHFGHENIINLCRRPFHSIANMNKLMIMNWNEVVAPTDDVFYLGDFALGTIADTLPIIKELNGNVTLICGNHDRPWIGHSEKRRDGWKDKYLDAGFYDVWDGIDDTCVYRHPDNDDIDMCHFPFFGDSGGKLDRYSSWRPQNYGQWLLHGHTHSKERVRDKMIHVGVDAWNYYPVSEDDILKIMKTK